MFEADAPMRMERGEVAEVPPGALLPGNPPVDPRDLGQGPLRPADALDQVALAQSVAADQCRRNLRIGGGGGGGPRPSGAPFPCGSMSRTPVTSGAAGACRVSGRCSSVVVMVVAFADGAEKREGGGAASGRLLRLPPGGGNDTSGTGGERPPEVVLGS